MSAGALFSNNASRGASKYLVEFKAGKMLMKGKMVYPDTRKGQLYVYQSDDALMHFCWKDRTSGVVEDDLIIFPDDCEFKHVPQCETGRVYLLRFKLSSRKFFFWLQDLKTDKDKDHCRKINEVLNNPPTPGSQRSGGASHDRDLQNLLNNMSQRQLMQLFGGVGQIGGLGSLLGTMNQPHGARVSTTTASTQVTANSMRSSAAQTPTPTTVTESPKPAGTPKPATGRTATPTNLLGITSPNNTIHLSDLQSFLSGIPAPAGSEPVAQSGQAGPVIRQFGLGPDAVNAAASGNLEEFVSALESEAKSGNSGGQPTAVTATASPTAAAAAAAAATTTVTATGTNSGATTTTVTTANEEEKSKKSSGPATKKDDNDEDDDEDEDDEDEDDDEGMALD